MRAELPWNVAGIPPEAREAARAAARREGLSVGEWLTRRILRSFSGLEEEFQGPGGADRPSLDSWGLPQSAASRRDTEDMLARVSRTETESSDTYRRIEEQLRSVGRRLDSTERSQSESNRAMNKAASEINIATREQAQAFDQLGGHVMGLADRMERLERSATQDGLKDAVKALHQGLSRLADQITQTANQSGTQVSSLAGTLEQLATRLGQMRADSEDAHAALEQRVAAVEKSSQLNYNALDHARADAEESDKDLAQRIDAAEQTSLAQIKVLDRARAEAEDAYKELAQRFDAVEQAAQAQTHALDQARAHAEQAHQEAAQRLDGVEKAALAQTQVVDQAHAHAQQAHTEVAQRLDGVEKAALAQTQVVEERTAALEKASQLNANALDHALERLEAQTKIRASDLADAQKRETQTQVALMRLEDNLGRLEQRSHDPAIDRRLDGIDHALADIVAQLESNSIEPFEESVRALSRRLEALDKKHAELLSELQAASKPAVPETPPFEPENSFAAPQFAPSPHTAFETSAFEAPPFAEPLPGPQAGFHPQNFDGDAFPPGFNAADPFAGGFAPDDFAAPPPAFDPAAYENSGDFATEAAAPADNFLSAARRSAQAASQAEAGRTRSGFNWDKEPAAETPRSRYLIPLTIALVVVIALAAALVLSQRAREKAAVSVPPKPATHSAPTVKPATPSSTAPFTPAPQGSSSVAPKAPVAAPKPVPARPALAHPVVVPPINASQAAPRPATPGAAPHAPAPATGDRLVQLANAGNAVAETVLGLKYLDGQGVPADLAQAGKLLSKAADQGQAVAQYRLGTMYERGQGTTPDGAKATKWYLASANQGNRKAMHNLAVAYADGAAGKKDMAEAARWFTKAAALGLSDSQFNLAVLYERGDGVPQSLIDAYKWYAIAAAAGDAESKQRLSVLQTQLSDADRAAAQKSAAGFHAAPLSRAANVPPDVADLPAQ